MSFQWNGWIRVRPCESGVEIRWASDNDSSASAVLRHRFPNVTFLEKDVRNLSVGADRLSEVDVLAAGIPCQSFSQAGGRRGLEDPRGRLFFEIPRLLAEFEPARRPRLIILENVPHLLYGAGKSWFDVVRRAIHRAGYWFREDSCWAANVKDATSLPQDRERLFMVAASREHFNYNPFVPPVSADEVNGHRKTLDEFIDRTKPGSRESYLSKENRYYKMIDREMASGESGTNIFQLRRSYVREKIWSLPDIDREHGYRRAQRAVRARPLGHSPVKRRRGSSVAGLRRS